MRAASWMRATCCTSPRSFSWCDREQSDVVESLKRESWTSLRKLFNSRNLSHFVRFSTIPGPLQQQSARIFNEALSLVDVRSSSIFFSFALNFISYPNGICRLPNEPLIHSLPHLSSSIVSWEEDPLERSSDAFRAD